MALRSKSQLPLPARLVAAEANGVAVPNLTRSGALPRLDPQAAIAPAMGMADIGAGLQKAGAAATALAEKRAEADSLTGQYKAAELLNDAQNRIKIATAEEQDSKKWGGIADGILNEAQTEIEKLGLDPRTRQIVDHKFAMNKTDVMGALGSHAAAKSLADGRAALGNTMKLAGVNGDPVLFRETLALATAGPHPFFTESEAKLAEIAFTHQQDVNAKVAKAKQYDQHQNNVVQIASSMTWEDTQKMMGMPGFAKGLDDADKERLRNVAQAVSRDRSAEVMGEVANGIADGTIKSAADVMAIDSPFLTPAMRADKIDILRTFDAQKAKLARAGPEGQAAFIQGYIDARNWQPDMGKPEESGRELAQKIQWVRNNVTDDLQGEVTMVLHGKFGATTKDDNVRPEIQKAVSQSIAATYEKQLEPFKREQARAEAVYNAYDPEKEGNSRAYKDALGFVLENADKALYAKRQEIFKAGGQVNVKMGDFFKTRKDPKPGDSDVWDALNKELPAGTRVMRIQSLMPDPVAPSIGGPDQAAIDAESARQNAGKTFKQLKEEDKRTPTATDAPHNPAPALPEEGTLGGSDATSDLPDNPYGQGDASLFLPYE